MTIKKQRCQTCAALLPSNSEHFKPGDSICLNCLKESSAPKPPKKRRQIGVGMRALLDYYWERGIEAKSSDLKRFGASVPTNAEARICDRSDATSSLEVLVVKRGRQYIGLYKLRKEEYDD